MDPESIAVVGQLNANVLRNSSIAAPEPQRLLSSKEARLPLIGRWFDTESSAMLWMSSELASNQPCVGLGESEGVVESQHLCVIAFGSGEVVNDPDDLASWVRASYG